MMYEELIKALRKQAINLPEKFSKNSELLDLLMKTIDAIEELQAQLMFSNDAAKAIAEKVPRWIPVTERLPKKDVPVFVYLFGDVPYIAWINSEDEWETEQFTIDYDYLPKAWMPLPEPQKEEN